MKNLLILLVFSLFIAGCADEFENSEMDKENLNQELSPRGFGNTRSDDNTLQKAACSCETMTSLFTQTVNSDTGCCTFTMWPSDFELIRKCGLTVDINNNGTITRLNSNSTQIPTFSACYPETITVTVSDKNDAECFQEELSCFTACGCDVQIEQNGCEITACVDKNSCDFSCLHILAPDGYTYVWDEVLSEDDDHICMILTALADIEYIVRVCSGGLGACVEDTPVQVEGCVDCSDPNWDISLDGFGDIDVYCDNADAFRVRIPVMDLEVKFSPCCIRDESPFTVASTYTWYNYSHDPPSIIRTKDTNFNFDNGWGIARHIGVSFPQDCDDYAVGDHLHFEFEYEITDLGDCHGDVSGSFVDYYIVQYDDLVPCCILPCDCEIDLTLNGCTLEACVAGEHGWCHGPYTNQWSDPPFGTPNLPEESMDNCNEITIGEYGEYCLTVTDARGCEVTKCQTVNFCNDPCEGVVCPPPCEDGCDNGLCPC